MTAILGAIMVSVMSQNDVFQEFADALGPSRRRVLGLLQESADPLPIDQIAGPLGLHPNSARFHLDALLKQGLVRRVRENRSVQGRPRILFAASPASPSVDDSPYRELVQALLAFLRANSDTDPDLPETVGATWGRELAQRNPELPALEGLMQNVNQIGFASRLIEDEQGPLLEIARCPFRDLVLGGHEAVCQIHLGMIRAYLAERGAGERVTDLVPWVTPDVCHARFTRTPQMLMVGTSTSG
jgi:predicted ArsR family transcriptional regulator